MRFCAGTPIGAATKSAANPAKIERENMSPPLWIRNNDAVVRFIDHAADDFAELVLRVNLPVLRVAYVGRNAVNALDLLAAHAGPRLEIGLPLFRKVLRFEPRGALTRSRCERHHRQQWHQLLGQHAQLLIGELPLSPSGFAHCE